MDRILIVEDDELIAELEQDYLLAEGMESDIVANGAEAVRRFREREYSAVLLDLMLPGKSGFDICREIRTQSDVPILLVTAKKEDIDKIKGLGLGADDYVVKPFSPVELTARVKAHMQIHKTLKEGNKEDVIFVGSLRIYPGSYRAYRGEQNLELTSREFQLLMFLAQNLNIVFTRQQIFDNVWGMEAVGDMSTVTVYVNKLRDKIEDDPSEPKYIQTVWGVGYRFTLVTNRPNFKV
ncbi:response regulator transcription factor [Claveliimonas bilis]|uniref:response regulator transcription factor n=1 Tax=Clostridia TaxID=186801 RepID=UPI001C3A1C16|nr:response regulator transcription factor [Claveliimonas bilis]MCQ5203556.1 response regulator transcription factor [Mordavella massiliensis]BDZ80256.1 DNA-binding response regulator [Claveliimonas bilis]HIZ60316.1 response regulator transcription factor [Candidatus Dorea faecipullorum]